MRELPAGPNFLLIGTAKAGTTALYEFLRQHPSIFMTHPVKEPKFFAYEGGVPEYTSFPKSWKRAGDVVTDAHEYLSLFDDAGHFPARGEASTLYLYHREAPERIRAFHPDMRMFAILRQPADRAFSHHLMLRASGVEPLTFEDALRQEPVRIANNWAPTFHYAACGRYHEQLTRYLAIFPKEQLKIFLYEDFLSDPRSVIRDVCEFLSVDPEFDPDFSARHNVTVTPKNALAEKAAAILRPAGTQLRGIIPAGLHKSATALAKRLVMKRPQKISMETREALTATFAEDIRKLQDLVGRDLTSWLTPSDP